MMPVRVHWLDDRCETIVITYEDRWTWDEWLTEVDSFVSLHHINDKTVSFIGDHRRSSYVPMGVLKAAKVVNSTSFISNIERIVLIGVPGILAGLLTFIVKLYPVLAERYQFCDTFDEALSLIHTS